MRRLGILIIIAVAAIAGSGYAWTEPRQLTDQLNAIIPQVVCEGKNLYVACWGPGGNDFYFLRSRNNGLLWSNPIQPADTFARASATPDIEYTSDSLLHVVWLGQYEGIFEPQIFHQSSSDGGRHWSNRHRAFNNEDEGYLAYPRLASTGDTLFMICRNTYYLLFFRSFNSGLTWQDSTVIDTAESMSNPPTILYSQGRLHVVYQLNISDGGIKVYYSRSDDLGLSWTPRIFLSTYESGPYYDSQAPSAYADQDGNIVAAWFDYQYGSYCGLTGDILARMSTDNGDTWFPETRLTNTQSGHATSCLILNNIIYVVWDDSWPLGCDYPKIVLSKSENWGTSWSQPEPITDDRLLTDQAPFLIYSIASQDTLLHCFYNVYNSSYGSDLFYVRNKEFLSKVKEMPVDLPVQLKAHPNVFNDITTMNYKNERGGEATLEIYDVLGHKVWSKQAVGKEGSVIWDGTDACFDQTLCPNTS